MGAGVNRHSFAKCLKEYVMNLIYQERKWVWVQMYINLIGSKHSELLNERLYIWPSDRESQESESLESHP